MVMGDTALLLAVTEAREVCKGKKTLRSRLLAAMKATKNHWLVTDDNTRLQAAVAATMMESEEDDKERLKEEWDALKHLSAALSGVGTLNGLVPPKRPVGIVKMWAELK
jgi:hypothetical protein